MLCAQSDEQSPVIMIGCYGSGATDRQDPPACGDSLCFSPIIIIVFHKRTEEPTVRGGRATLLLVLGRPTVEVVLNQRRVHLLCASAHLGEDVRASARQVVALLWVLV